MAEQYTPDEEDLEVAWIEYIAADDTIDEAAAEAQRSIAQIKRDAARSALDGLLKHIGHPSRPSPMIGPGGLQHYIRANHPEETP